MMVLSCSFVGLFIVRLIRRHGWEYVPVVLLALGASLYLGNEAPAGAGDGVLFAAIAGVHLVTRKDIMADAAM